MQGGLGLELAQRHHPDLILLDLHLPDIPGPELFDRLRADERTREIPVVIVSADATDRQVRRLLEAGAADYLTKPIDLRQFLAIIQRYANPAPSGAPV
jgi:CheY-like chemotaxis protein